MTWRHLDFDKRGSIAVLTINNPNKMNSMNKEFIDNLKEAVDICENDKDIRCVILTGFGTKAFTAGGDLKLEGRFTPQEALENNEQGNVVVKSIMESRLPYIASVNGYALGAAIGLILACDISIAAENAIFGIPTTSLGGIPGWGCTQLTTRMIGAQNAKLLLLANEKFNAEEAYKLGLVSKVVKQEELINITLEYAYRIATYAPNAVASTKFAVNKGLESSLEEGFQIEAYMVKNCNSNYNFKEGIAAFLEKRSPNFNYGGSPPQKEG